MLRPDRPSTFTYPPQSLLGPKSTRRANKHANPRARATLRSSHSDGNQLQQASLTRSLCYIYTLSLRESPSVLPSCPLPNIHTFTQVHLHTCTIQHSPNMSTLIQPTPIRFMMPSAQAAPFMHSSQKNTLRVPTSQDLFSSISASLSSNNPNRPGTPNHQIFADDYTVPAPPPPSPVSFRPDCWPKPARS